MRLVLLPSFVAVGFPALAMVRRELLTSLRSRWVIAILLAFMGLAVLVILSEWPKGDRGIAWVGYMSRTMVEILAMSIFAGCVLFVPAYAASAIVLEREQSTYDFLRMSMISPLGIVFAKLLNAVGMFFIILIAIMPIMSTAFFLIGVDYSVFLKVSVVIATTIFSCASIGLACSSIFRKSITTIAASYIGVAMLMIGPLLLAYIFASVAMAYSYSRTLMAVVEIIGTHTSPLATMVYALEIDTLQTTYEIIAGLAYQCVVIGLCLFIAWWNVRRPVKPQKISQEKPIDDKAALRARKLGFPYYILDPLKRKKPIEDGRNPMTVREVRWGLFNRGTVLIRVFYVALVVYFIAGAVAWLDARTYSGMREWFVMQTMLTILVAPGLIANSLTKEYELGNLDMLRMTLLRPKDIILGKYAAGFASVSPLLAAAVLSCIPVIVMGIQDYIVLVVGYANLMVCTILSISIGLFSSLLTKQTTISIMVSYVISIILFFGVMIITELLDISPYGAKYSPVFVLYYIIGQASAGGGAIDYTLWLISSVVTLAIAGCMVLSSVFIFLRYKMRDR